MIIAAVTAGLWAHGALWTAELAGFDALNRRQPAIGKAVGNTMIPVWLCSLGQQRLVKMFGKMRLADPVRWAAYADGHGGADVVLVYPSVDKVAKMTLNHPGAERRGRDMVWLPKDEGRPMAVFGVFSRDFDYCAFGATEKIARAALEEKYPAAGEALLAIESSGVAGAFDFEEDGFVYRSRTSDETNVAKLRKMPFFGRLAGDGRTHKVTFEDVKKLIADLCKEFIGAKFEGKKEGKEK